MKQAGMWFILKLAWVSAAQAQFLAYRTNSLAHLPSAVLMKS